jgi:phosphoacetylglucosamine mutase
MDPKDPSKPKVFKYGTAGFRTLGSHLERVCFRVGILVALRAKLTMLGGVMITASHNQKDDNGVKIIESDGSMLSQAWEPLAETLANAPDIKAALEELDASPDKNKYGFMESIFSPVSFVTVCFGMDTRETSPMLIEAAMTGAKLMGVNVTNHGLCTTPMLHWLVSQQHTNQNDVGLYYQHFKDKLLSFISLCQNEAGFGDKPKQNYQSDIILDCANGVGAQAISQIMELAGFNEKLQITLINNEKSPEKLNDGCGAEFVQKDQKLPTGWSVETHVNKKCMSFDGDADRQMYFYGDENSKLSVIDGDK